VYRTSYPNSSYHCGEAESEMQDHDQQRGQGNS